MKWFYQERYTVWTLWAFGWTVDRKGGWAYDELRVYVGPLRFMFLGEPK